MSGRGDCTKPAEAADPLFSPEIDDGAILAGIAAVVVVVGMLVCSIVTKGEVQSASKSPPAATVGQSIAAANR